MKRIVYLGESYLLNSLANIILLCVLNWSFLMVITCPENDARLFSILLFVPQINHGVTKPNKSISSVLG
jgi:hypothetical protein